jgi:hypothetical protein
MVCVDKRKMRRIMKEKFCTTVFEVYGAEGVKTNGGYEILFITSWN